MILGYHVIFCAYGFWLPNDPRGSWSDFVGAWELLRYSHATTTDTRRSVAAIEHDRQQREAAKRALKFPPVSFRGVQARAIGRGFATAIKESGYTIHACAILPEHVHMVIARCDRHVEQIVSHLKARATQRLTLEKLHPLQSATASERPTPWARNCWKVYLDDGGDMRRAINYVEQNPVKEGKRPQQWWFARPYGQATPGKPGG